jgi:hypothetical protein
VRVRAVAFLGQNGHVSSIVRSDREQQ